MFPKMPGANVWVSMELPPPLEPHTVTAPVIVMVNLHAVVVGEILGGNTIVFNVFMVF